MDRRRLHPGARRCKLYGERRAPRRSAHRCRGIGGDGEHGRVRAVLGNEIQAEIGIAGILNGKGKAGIEGWVAVVKPGRVLFEMDGVSRELAREAMRLAIYKMPMRCKFYSKDELEAELKAKNIGGNYHTPAVTEEAAE